MLESLKRNLFPFLIAFSALSVSASAAFYSVTGLSKLFAGASFEVLIMAASLEVAKLVIASLLYQYWDTLNRWLKTYLMIAAIVLVFITSMGIYGFLSAAYQETATKMGNIDAQVELIETKRDNLKERLAIYTEEKQSLNEAMSELRTGLSNNVIQYKDKETGEIITTTSRATRQALERQLDQAISRQDELNSRIDAVNEEIFEYEAEIVELETGGDVAGELGPLKYLSGLTGIPMDQIINYLLLIIIFVFDPLAISLVVAANFAFDKANPNRRRHEPLPSKSIWEDIEEELDQDVEMFMNDILPDDEFDTWDDDGGLEDEEEPNEALKTAADRYKQYAEDILDKPYDSPGFTRSEFTINQDELEAWTKIADELAEGSQLLDEDELLEDEFGHFIEDEESITKEEQRNLLSEMIKSDEEAGLYDPEEEWDEEHALDQVLNDMVEQLDEEDLKELEVEAEAVSNKFEVENTQGDVTVIEEDQSDQTEMETDRVGTFPNQVNPTSVGSIVQKLDTPHLPKNEDETSKVVAQKNKNYFVDPKQEEPKFDEEKAFEEAMRKKAEEDKQQFLRDQANARKNQN